MAANLSGGGFSVYFERPGYQAGAALNYLDQPIRHPDDSLYQCARCRDLAFSYFVICAAVMVVATPTSPGKRSITTIS